MDNAESYPDAGGPDQKDLTAPQADRWIRVRNLAKSFQNGGVRIDVLQEVNLDLEIGQTMAIVGASGIGKSTLLHILGTLDRPDSGTLEFQGEDVFLFNDFKLAQFRNRTIGFVFQFHHLLPEFTAEENVAMPLLVRRTPVREASAQAGLHHEAIHHRLDVVLLVASEAQRIVPARPGHLVEGGLPFLMEVADRTEMDRKGGHLAHRAADGRFVLRESGRDETIGGGEVLDIEPVMRASRAAPCAATSRPPSPRA